MEMFEGRVEKEYTINSNESQKDSKEYASKDNSEYTSKTTYYSETTRPLSDEEIDDDYHPYKTSKYSNYICCDTTAINVSAKKLKKKSFTYKLYVNADTKYTCYKSSGSKRLKISKSGKVTICR